MMKKRFPALAATLCLTLVTAACGAAPATQATASASAAAEQPSASSAASATASADSGKTTEISWFVNTGVVPSKWDLSQYVMKTITQDTGVTVTANTPADDADTKLNLMIVNGNLPDIVTLTNETLIKEMISAGLVWNLDEFFKTYLPNSKLVTGGYPTDVKNALIARDGAWYALPSHIKSADNRAIWGMNETTKALWMSTDNRENCGVVFNKTLMDKAGVTKEELTTEEGVLAAFEKVKQAKLSANGASVYTFLADGNSYNGGSWRSDYGSIGALTRFFGGMPVDATGKYRSWYYDNAFKHALKFLNTCAQKGYVDANQFTLDRAAREAACRAGRVFCFMGNTADTGFYDVDNNGFEFYTPGAILSTGGEAPALGVSKKVGRGWLQNFVTKNTKNPEAVARFLDYMSSEKGLTVWNYGEPDVDYTKSPEGLLSRTKAGSEKANNASVTGVGAFWAFCNQNFDQKYMDPKVDRGIEPQCAFGSNPKTFIYDTSVLDLPGGYINDNTDMNNITVEIKSYVQTELVSIILEAKDNNFDARYQALLKQLDTLGLPKLDEYVDKAVQENYKTFGYSLKAKN